MRTMRRHLLYTLDSNEALQYDIIEKKIPCLDLNLQLLGRKTNALAIVASDTLIIVNEARLDSFDIGGFL